LTTYSTYPVRTWTHRRNLENHRRTYIWSIHKNTDAEITTDTHTYLGIHILLHSHMYMPIYMHTYIYKYIAR
jgi:hypothetical protein